MSDKEIQNHDEEIKLYELGFNLVSSIAEGELDKEFISLKNIITKHKGEIISESNPALINLAYTMMKNIDSKKVRYDQAYFGWIKFNVSPEMIDKLNKDIESIPSMLRFMIITATEEGNISAQAVSKEISGEKTDKQEETDDVSKDEDFDDENKLNDDKKEDKASLSEVDIEEVDGAIDDLIQESK